MELVTCLVLAKCRELNINKNAISSGLNETIWTVNVYSLRLQLLYQQKVEQGFYPRQHQNIRAVCQILDKKVITSDKTAHPKLLTCC